MRLSTGIFACLLAACASAAPGTIFERSLGTASGPDAIERSGRVLREFQYEVDREEETPRLITIQTRWKRRSPFEDERAIGISAAETRVTVTARHRQETVAGALYGVSLSIENRVQLASTTEWLGEHASPMYRTYADSLASRLQRELTVGVRR